MKLSQLAGRVLATIQLFRISRGSNCRVRGFLKINNRGTIRLGSNISFHSHIQRSYLSVHEGAVLSVGDNSFINFGANISVSTSVTIGNGVQIGPYCLIYDSDFHSVDPTKPAKCAPVVIEDNVWIASRCTILKGVTIGRGAVVSTGAVVTRDVPAGAVVGGVPAKVIMGGSHE